MVNELQFIQHPAALSTRATLNSISIETFSLLPKLLCDFVWGASLACLIRTACSPLCSIWCTFLIFLTSSPICFGASKDCQSTWTVFLEIDYLCPEITSPFFRSSVQKSSGPGLYFARLEKYSTMDDEQETYKLWRIRKTIMQLCHDRGYLVTQDELDQTLDQFKVTFTDQLIDFLLSSFRGARRRFPQSVIANNVVLYLVIHRVGRQAQADAHKRWLPIKQL